MDKRTMTILSSIVKRPSRYDYEDLSKITNKTVRTIRIDIDKINYFLSEYNLDEIKLDEKNKFYIEMKMNSFEKVISNMNLYSYILSKSERVKFISMLLMIKPGYTTINEIADFMAISRSTVIGCMEPVTSLLKKHNIEVESLSGKGLKLKADEIYFRKLMIDLLIEDYFLFVLFTNQNRLFDFLKGTIIDNTALPKIKNIINLSESSVGVSLTEKSFKVLNMYLALMLYRIYEGHTIYKKVEEECTSTEFADDIYKCVLRYFDIDENEQERILLSNLIGTLSFEEKIINNSNILKIQTLTRKFIEIVSEEISMDLNADYDLFEGLSNHLESIFRTGKADLKDNMDLTDISNKYKDVYEVVKEKMVIFEEYAGRDISENEIVYVMIYICAAMEKIRDNRDMIDVILICNSGIGTSQLLKARLRKFFSMNIVDVISVRKTEGYSFEDIDLVISTIDVNNIGVPVVKVTPYINDNEYLKILKKIDEISYMKSVKQLEKNNRHKEYDGLMRKINNVTRVYEGLSQEIEEVVKNYFKKQEKVLDVMLSEYLSPEFIELDVECSDWKDSIRKAGDILYRQGYIKERYMDAMIKNVEENGPYIVLSKGFAVPHGPINSGTKKTGFSLIRLKNPVEYGAGILDPVEFVCCLSSTDNKKHLKAFFNLVNMFSISSFREELGNAKTSEEVAEIIEIYERKLT